MNVCMYVRTYVTKHHAMKTHGEVEV